MRPPYSLLHLAKDLRIEWRSRDAINSMLFFSLLVVVIFSLAFDPTHQFSRRISGPIICVAILFAAVHALNQAWARELRNHVLDAHRMSAAPPASLFLGKVLANFIFVSIIEAVLTPLFVVFYNLSALGNGWLLLGVIPLGTWAILVNGTFFAALSIRARSRELLLPLILFPIFMPALLAMSMGVSVILNGGSDPGAWIKMLGAYDVIFTVLSLLLFETVLNAE